MSWGHATSTDLLTWTEHPVAIACDEEEDIFSGSIVFDRHNTSGFGTDSTAPLVAIYTSAYQAGSAHHGIQAQSLAYSLDGGYTWTKHTSNPVLDRGSADFRDPKVFRYESHAGSYWVMVAVEAQDFQVVFYKSHDLKDWELLSSFGPANATGGVWECPDLFPLPVDGDPENLKWVLTVNLNPGGPNSGSAGQYFVGDFDGTTFTSATTVTEGLQDPDRLGEYQWLDWGRDYYAAVSFSDAPDNRRLMIAWMNNWQYANEIPTSPWRSPMSLVREVSLHSVDGSWRLVQQVASGSWPQTLARARHSASRQSKYPTASTSWTAQRAASNASSSPSRREQPRNSGWSSAATERREPASASVPRKAASSSTAGNPGKQTSTNPSPPSTPPRSGTTDGSYELTIYVDRCSVEVFAQGGQVTLTELIFPAATSTEVSLYAIGGTATINSLSVTQYA